MKTQGPPLKDEGGSFSLWHMDYLAGAVEARHQRAVKPAAAIYWFYNLRATALGRGRSLQDRIG